MTRIDAAAALGALLKSQLEVTARATAGSANAPATEQRAQKGKDQAKAETRGALQLEPQMVRRVREISEKDPERRRKVFRVFLESVLLKQLGFSTAADADFIRLVDRVMHEIDSDAALRESSLVAADVLIQQCR